MKVLTQLAYVLLRKWSRVTYQDSRVSSLHHSISCFLIRSLNLRCNTSGDGTELAEKYNAK